MDQVYPVLVTTFLVTILVVMHWIYNGPYYE